MNKYSNVVKGDLEKFLQEKILPDLEKGRPKDKPHTLDVVSKIKEIVTNSPGLNLDLTVLIIAGYGHDWGYSGLFDNSQPLTLAQLGAEKDNHMAIGGQKLSHLLDDPFFSFLTAAQKKRAIHLVSVHDKLDSLRDLDEIVLMEADSLGGMNAKIMGTFDEAASEERYMRKARELRLSRFITDYGKREFERLFQEREEYYRQKQK